MGIENKDIAASLYKLLIYKEGDFFLPHKDSEKEKGMFGTLIIGLPAKHTDIQNIGHSNWYNSNEITPR